MRPRQGCYHLWPGRRIDDAVSEAHSEIQVLNADRIDDLDTLGPGYDHAVALTDGISRYCSSRDWAVSAANHLHPGRVPYVVQRDNHYVALTLGDHDQVGPYLQGLEADWGFTSPLLGPDSERVLSLLSESLMAWEPRWSVALLNGLDFDMAQRVALQLEDRYRVVLRHGIQCQVASLDGGLDGFMSRRSANLRRNLRRDGRRATREGFEMVSVAHNTGARELMQRVLAVERRSWKTDAGQSVLASPRYRSFYTGVLQRASARGALRAAFATRNGVDHAYVFGGVIDEHYRGFQLGYDHELRHLGLGNLVQVEMIDALSRQQIRTYDLGMEMPYKARWAEHLLRLHTVVVVNTRR